MLLSSIKGWQFYGHVFPVFPIFHSSPPLPSSSQSSLSSSHPPPFHLLLLLTSSFSLCICQFPDMVLLFTTVCMFQTSWRERETQQNSLEPLEEHYAVLGLAIVCDTGILYKWQFSFLLLHFLSASC